MKVQQFRSAGLVALSYSMALLSVGLRATTAQYVCVDSYIRDGDCDANNNNADCGKSLSAFVTIYKNSTCHRIIVRERDPSWYPFLNMCPFYTNPIPRQISACLSQILVFFSRLPAPKLDAWSIRQNKTSARTRCPVCHDNQVFTTTRFTN